jgi:DNA-binding NarL/FixJ family response regulator
VGPGDVGDAGDPHLGVHVADEVLGLGDVVAVEACTGATDNAVTVDDLLATPRIGRLVACSFTADHRAANDVLSIGFDGYVSLAAPAGEIVAALEQIHRGERRVILLPEAQRNLPIVLRPSEPEGLTPREAEILTLITRGLSNEEIARICFLSINTVKTYVRSAYRKAGVATRAQAGAWSIGHGLGEGPAA